MEKIENKKKIIDIFRDSGRLEEELCKSVECDKFLSAKKAMQQAYAGHTPAKSDDTL